MTNPPPVPSLSDAFGRRISYVRLSVTDRCDLRCRYCMSEAMSFLPRRELLSLEELDRLCTVFVERLGAAPAVARDMSMTGG